MDVFESPETLHRNGITRQAFAESSVPRCAHVRTPDCIA